MSLDSAGCQNGGVFSTVELMVALAIAALLMAVGAPAMGSFVKGNRIQAKTFEMLRTIHYARSEAAKRKVRVVLCRSADPSASPPTCSGTAFTWTSGYLVFASGDGNNTYQDDIDDLLRIGVTANGDISIISNSTSNNNLEYNPDGTTNESGGTARFAVCDNRGGDFGRQIDVAPVGRPSLKKGNSAAPINCTSPA